MDGLDPELDPEFIERFRTESAKRIREMKARNQLVEVSTWLNWTAAVGGVKPFLELYYETHAADGGSTRTKLRAGPWWVNAIRCFIVYFTLKLIVLCVLQYNYDWHKLDYKTFSAASLNASNSSNNSNSSDYSLALKLELEQKLKLDRFLLKLIGSPFLEYSFVIQVCYLALLGATVFACTLAPIYFAINGVNFSLLATLFDWQREQRHQDNQILQVINEFFISGRNFTRTKLLESWALAGKMSSSCRPFASLRQTRSRTEHSHAVHYIRAHREAVQQLKQMALEGLLQPLNRTPEWIMRISRWYNLLGVGFLVYTIPIFALIFSAALWLRDLYELDVASWQDILLIVELALMCNIMVTNASFYLPLVTMTLVDHIHLIVALRKEIQHCIVLDEVEFYWDAGCRFQGSGDDDDDDDDNDEADVEEPTPNSLTRMSGHVTLVFMHYRILARELIPFQRMFGLMMLIIGLIALYGSVITLSNIHYFEDERTIGLALLTISALLMACECILAPICYMHSRCQQLHKSLYSLFARLAEKPHRSHSDNSTTGTSSSSLNLYNYNPHLMALIKKELDETVLRLKQFAPTALGFQLTYASYMKLHFWGGLIIFSLLIYIYNPQNNNNALLSLASFI